MTRRVALVLLGVACRHAPPARETPPVVHDPVVDAAPVPVVLGPLDHDLPRLVEQTLQLYQTVTRVLATAGDDCARATAQLVELQGRVADVVIANAKVTREGRVVELRAALEPHQADFDSAAKALAHSPTLAKCAGDHAFEEAFDRLLEPPP